LKVFLDMCCYNRPYDPQEQVRIQLETVAKLHLQEAIREQKLELVSSYTLDYEISNVPDNDRRETINRYIREYSNEYLGIENSVQVEKLTKELMGTGLKEQDAGHVASAILSKCDYFITTYIRLLKHQYPEIKLINPVDFVLFYFGKEGET